MSATRTDIHRPAVMDPADYIEVGYSDNHPTEGGSWIDPEYTNKESFQGRYSERGGCDHCGHHSLRYVVHFLHVPTDKVVSVGETCSSKLNLPSRRLLEFKRNAERAALDKKRHDFAQREPEVASFLVDYHVRVYEGPIGPDGGHEINYRKTNEFYDSLYSAMNRYGSLSERQIEAVKKAMAREAQWKVEREAERANEPDPSPVPITDERIQITGKILSVKYKENEFGGSFKMTVLDDRGFKVWGTRPDSLLVAAEGDEGFIEHNGLMHRPADRGDRVTFQAQVSRSDRDEDFGFFKRPTQGRVINGEEQLSIS